MHSMSIHIAKPGREPRVIAWEFPESFDEFNRGQLLALATYVDTVGSDQLAYVKLVRALLGIRRRWLKYVDGELLFFPEEDEDGEPRMLPQLDYLKETYKNSRSLLQKVGPWRGPEDDLKNMTVERIAFADTLTAAYREAPTPELLNQVWAAIYTPAGLRWKASRIERVAWWARLVPRRIKLAAMLNYRGMLLANMDRFPEVYKGGTTDGTEVFGWEGTIQRLAKAQTFGPYQQAKDILFLQAMTHFSINAIEIKNLEREREKNKTK